MIVETIINFVVDLIGLSGYFGLFILMALESMIAPIPSEAVMPFAGFLIYKGQFALATVALISALGSIFGSLLSYWIGIFGGRRFVLRFGKYLLLDENHLVWTENFFKRYGDKTIFISRFIPVVRHLISIPAGIGRMNIKKFIIYTFSGAIIWNTFLAYLGLLLRERWTIVHNYSKELDIAAGIILVGLLSYYLIKLKKRRKNV